MIHDLDRLLHEPARLLIIIYLYSVDQADFTFLRNQTGMTQGNLSSHLTKLESAEYIHVEKLFKNRRPLTLIRISDRGKSAFREYVKQMHRVFNDLIQVVS